MKKVFNPQAIEKKWYKEWESSGYFKANPKSRKPSFSIMIPPPNITGSLHMGHGFQNALMDALIRHKRMSGYDTLWQVGTDHAGIATQMVVERELEKKGLSREGLGRKEFIKKVWEWKDKSGNNITNQLRRLGSSVDWSREAFTMSPEMSKSVQEVFIRLYEEGLIYRGQRLVNWDVTLQTAVSDLEVSNLEENTSLWFFKYPLVKGDFVTIATTRPETMLGDTALAVNPKDGRYKNIIGEKIKLPLSNREISIIGDDFVDPEFGTGCVKITPGHDFNDFDIGKKHKLPLINTLNLDGTLNNEVPKTFRGLTVTEARKKVVKEMEKLELLEKIEPYKTSIPRGDRSDSILEPLLTHQWFLNVKKMSKVAVDVVKKEQTEFIPKNWENTYFAWMNEIQDWCISRQLWWGHRIPAWLDKDKNIYVGENEENIRKKYNLDPNEKINQEEDVLDTWFSSALWTFSTLGWPSKNNLLKKYHPSNVLVTGFDIIFFWVARMIMMTTHFISEVPFKKIFIHGLIKDSEGQKMSKSKGNILDPLDIIDGIGIEELLKKRTEGLMQPKMKEKIESQTLKEFPKGIEPYGTDALRLAYCSLASGSRDVNFDMKRVEGYRNFCNKLWNAARFINLQLSEIDGLGRKESKDSADVWIREKLKETSQKVNLYFDEFRFDLITQTIYDFIWNEFCDWYIEISKIRLSSQNYKIEEKKSILTSLVSTLEETLRLAHPIMPFVTEELWQQFKKDHKSKFESIMISNYPNEKTNINKKEFDDIEWVKQVVSGIRNIRGEMNIKPSIKILVLLKDGDKKDHKRSEEYKDLICNLSGLSSLKWIESDDKTPPSAINFHKNLKVLIPLEGLIKVKEEKERIEKSIFKLKKENESISKQLNNKKFISKAPQELVKKQMGRNKEISKELKLLDIQIKEIQKLL